MRFRLRTLMILLAAAPPVLAGLVLLSPVNRIVLIDVITCAALFAALAALWEYWSNLTKWL